MTALYKVTDEQGRSFHGGKGRWQRNRWRSVKGELVPCQNGLHLCRLEDLIHWLGPVIWRAEHEGKVVTAGDKVVVRRARVVERLNTWNDRTARLFAADCAERAHPIFAKAYPDDDRPRMAIEAARAYARGEIGDAARDAAGDAARDAAWAAAGDAAWAAAGDAAGAAARAAAGDAARAAAGAAAWAAAGDAAGAAARAAAGDAAWAAAWAWQTDRLFDYLEGRAA